MKLQVNDIVVMNDEPGATHWKVLTVCDYGVEVIDYKTAERYKALGRNLASQFIPLSLCKKIS